MKRRICAALLAASMTFVAALGLSGCAGQVHYTLEAGESLPNPSSLVNAEGIRYVEGYDTTCVNKPGKYTIDMVDGEGNEYRLRLTVKDRTAPVVKSKHVYYALGTEEANARDFIYEIKEVDSYEAYFVGDVPEMDKLGDYDVSFKVKDASGNESELCESILSVIVDTEPPVFEELPELSAYVGDAIAYRQGLTVTDNCSNPIELVVNTDEVDEETPGDYPVYYTATDASGNVTEAETVIRIYENQITEEELYAEIDAVLARLVDEDMSVPEKLQKVHTYVQDNITFIDDSDKSDWVRSAYEGLFSINEGDCFSYMAAAKAFCIRLGIDYREIERTKGAAAGTHFWLMVNIGTDEDPRWYHYDCTPLKEPIHNYGCLLTTAQLNAYHSKRAGFYEYDESAYPTSESQVYYYD